MLKFLLFFFICFNLSATEEISDNDALDNIYKRLASLPDDLSKIEHDFRFDLIKSGGDNLSLQFGNQSFLSNVETIASMVNSNKIKLTMKTFIVRRIITGNMANDVGYRYSKMSNKEGLDAKEQLFKFSMVFVKKGKAWQTVTDFSSDKAPLSVLEDTEFVRIIE
ncbi:hypothetical protein [Paraglaciecola sp. L3A3]|uniref:hypothetical protein n=1 Tax=Paraglaciecola sp. L3A3 TaxID=2686358 RepID=UPI00131CD3CF|nr:hypothetical protein [Paraglaciecola sp. L3A3]